MFPPQLCQCFYIYNTAEGGAGGVAVGPAEFLNTGCVLFYDNWVFDTPTAFIKHLGMCYN